MATKLVVAVSRLVAVAAILPLTAVAAPITVPTGLSPGDQYRLAFVTSTATDLTSPNIADYNAFVTAVANSVPPLAALGTTWSAIASTASIDARDNTSTNPLIDPVGVPIYTLGNTRFAPTNSALWTSTTHPPLNIDQSGVTIPMSQPYVATGTLLNGVGLPGMELGDVGVEIGFAYSDGSNWIEFVAVPTANDPGPLYAMSGVLTVVPEPSTIVLACLAAAGLAVPLLRRCRRCRPLVPGHKLTVEERRAALSCRGSGPAARRGKSSRVTRTLSNRGRVSSRRGPRSEVLLARRW